MLLVKVNVHAPDSCHTSVAIRITYAEHIRQSRKRKSDVYYYYYLLSMLGMRPKRIYLHYIIRSGLIAISIASKNVNFQCDVDFYWLSKLNFCDLVILWFSVTNGVHRQRTTHKRNNLMKNSWLFSLGLWRAGIEAECRDRLLAFYIDEFKYMHQRLHYFIIVWPRSQRSEAFRKKIRKWARCIWSTRKGE